MLSTGAWNAMLKLLEEPPKTTIFILCTTDPQKIPATILSRVQRYDFQRISFEGIVTRLKYIIEQENNKYLDDVDSGKIEPLNLSVIDKNGLEHKHPFKIVFEQEALEYIAKIADGGMRDAISLLDKCIAFSTDLTVENVVKALGVSDYNNLDKLLYAILTNNNKECIDIIESIYRSGKDLKQFIKQFIQFILDVCKYDIYNNYDYIQIPNTIDLNNYLSVDYNDLLEILDIVIKINTEIKYETNPKILIESQLILFIRK